MSIQSQVSIVFDANTQPLRALQTRLRGVTRDLERASTATDRQGTSLERLGRRFSDQGLANIQAGLVQLSNYSLHLSQSINNVFEKAQNRYVSVDQALTQLRITMGLTGAQSLEMLPSTDKTVMEYKRLEEMIRRTARTTQFTAVEVTKLADTFRRTGKSVEETIKLTDLAQRLTAASAGAIDLERAGSLVLNTLNNAGQSADTLGRSLDRLIFASQNTALSIEDMAEGYKSLSGALQGLKANSNELDSFLYTIMAGYKQLGKSPREATQALGQTVKALAGVYKTVDRAFIRAGGKTSEEALKRAYGRVDQKRNVLLEALGIGTDSANVLEVAKREYGRITQLTIEAARDVVAKEMLFKDGAKVSGKALTQIVRTIRANLAKLGDGGMAVESRLKTAFGTDSLITYGRAIALVDKSGEELGLNFEGIMDRTTKAVGTLSSASDESLKSLASKIKLLESAEDSLSNAIFKHDLVAQGALDTYTDLVSTASALATGNEGLSKSIAAVGRAAQVASGFVTNLGFALTAMATFSIGLRYAQIDLASKTTTLARIFASFYSVFLAPTLIVMTALIGAVGLLGAGFVGYIKRMTGAQSTAEGFSTILEGLTTKIKVFGAMMRLAFGGKGLDSSKKGMEGYTDSIRKASKLQADLAITRLKLSKANTENERVELRKQVALHQDALNEINEQNQQVFGALGPSAIKAMRTVDSEMLSNLFKTGEKIVNAVRGIGVMIDKASEPLGFVFEVAIDAIVQSIEILMLPIRAIGAVFDFFSKSTDGTTKALSFLGSALGVFFGFKLLKTIIIGVIDGLVGLRANAMNAFNPTTLVSYVAELGIFKSNLQQAGTHQSLLGRAAINAAQAYSVFRNGVAGATEELRELNQVRREMQLSAGRDALSVAEQNFSTARQRAQFATEHHQRTRSQAEAREQRNITLGGMTDIEAARVRAEEINAAGRHRVNATRTLNQAEIDLANNRANHHRQQVEYQAREDAIRQDAIRRSGAVERSQGRLGLRMNELGGRALAFGAAIGGLTMAFPFLSDNASNAMGQVIMSIGAVTSAASMLAGVWNTGMLSMAASTLAAFWPLLLIAGAVGGLIYFLSKKKPSTPAQSAQVSASQASVPSAVSSSTPSAPTVPTMPTMSPTVPMNMTAATTTSTSNRVASAPVAPTTQINVENFNTKISAQALDAKDVEKAVRKAVRDLEDMFK